MSTRLCWLGHACLLLESDGKRVLIDPFLTDNPAAATTADKVEADAILVSHGHGDHVGDTIKIAKRTGAEVVCQLRDQRVVSEEGAEKGPRPAARRRSRLPVRPGEADAGVPRLRAARRDATAATRAAS